MAAKELQKIISPDGNPVMSDAAIRDGAGNNLEDTYAKQDGAYENLWAGNLITDQNWRWVNDFAFGTGTVDTVFYGEATIYAIRGKTEWDGTTPKYVGVYYNRSIVFNLYLGSYEHGGINIAHVPESDDENNGLCVWGTGVKAGTVMEFCEDDLFSGTITEIALTEKTNSTGDTYLHCSVPANGFLRFKSGLITDGGISNVWGGNRVNYHPAYEDYTCTITTSDFFPTGMKGITVNGENVCYDELYANKYYARVLEYSFGATPSISYVAASGTYNIYRMSLSNAMDKGACQIGGSTKFVWSDVGQMSSSTPLSADTMSLYTGYIYFAIAQSEDTTYTYSEDSAVVDAESFATQSALHTLYTESDGVYTEATEYVSDTTYYYISATDLHGLNGQAIVDEIKNKTIVYQRYSMDKSVYTGTAISPALDWTYKMGDFGTEELALLDGYPVVPDWVVYYPVNVLETVQQLPNNYISIESAENMLHQVGELQGFDFDNISVDSETGNMKVNGLVDTKETIIKIELTSEPANWETFVKNLYAYGRNKTIWIDMNFSVTSNINRYVGNFVRANVKNFTIIFDNSKIQIPSGVDIAFSLICYLASDFKGMAFLEGIHPNASTTYPLSQLWTSSYKDLVTKRPAYGREAILVQKYDEVGNCHLIGYKH